VIDALGLVTVPFQAWFSNGASPEKGLQLVDFSRTTVNARGRIDQPGLIQRAFPVGTRLGTLSDLAFATSDLADRDRPAVLGTVELVRNVVDFARVGGGAGVQLIAPTDWWRQGALRLRTVDLAHVDDGQFLAELTLGSNYGRMLRDGDLLYV